MGPSSAPGPADGNKRKGFASLSPERRREMARRGGQAAHRRGTAHEWSAEEARAAGKKGGTISRGGRGRLPASTAPALLPGEKIDFRKSTGST